MSEKWPITSWKDDDGKMHFKVWDDQGYNFSFDRMAHAVEFQRLSETYTRVMRQRMKPMVERFKEEVLS